MRPYYGFAGSPVIEVNLVLVAVNTGGIGLETTGKLVWQNRNMRTVDVSK